jgi:Cu+-exporting ATPase
MTKGMDPVCGVTVDDETAPARSTYEGHSYSFCSVGCKARWDVNPGKYATKPAETEIPDRPA